jgi:hypothetical protein
VGIRPGVMEARTYEEIMAIDLDRYNSVARAEPASGSAMGRVDPPRFRASCARPGTTASVPAPSLGYLLRRAAMVWPWGVM